MERQHAFPTGWTSPSRLLSNLGRVKGQTRVIQECRQVHLVQPRRKSFYIFYFAPEQRAAVLVLVLVVQPNENAEFKLVRADGGIYTLGGEAKGPERAVYGREGGIWDGLARNGAWRVWRRA